MKIIFYFWVIKKQISDVFRSLSSRESKKIVILINFRKNVRDFKVFSMNLFFYYTYYRFIKYNIINFSMLFNKQIKFEFKSRGCIFEFDLDLRKASSEFQPVRIPTLFKCLFLTDKRERQTTQCYHAARHLKTIVFFFMIINNNFKIL